MVDESRQLISDIINIISIAVGLTAIVLALRPILIQPTSNTSLTRIMHNQDSTISGNSIIIKDALLPSHIL